MKSKRLVWTDEEFELVAEVYGNLLEKELKGEPYNKQATAKVLADCIGKSRCSVEYMWQNVSYVLTELGRRRIKGYKPRRNCGKALKQAVLKTL